MKLNSIMRIVLLSTVFWLMSTLTCISQNGTNLNYILANDAGFEYVGRYITEGTTIKYGLPGVSIYASFGGPNLELVFKDFGNGSVSNTNFLTVLIDELPPIIVQLNPNDTIYTISNALENKNHRLQIIKRTESLVGNIQFKGIKIHKDYVVGRYQDLPNRKMLLIGNSITCGYGNVASIPSNPNTGFTSKNEDNYHTYGQLAARSLNAQYMAFAYSGRGLMKNNDGSTSGIIPTIFDRVFPDNAAYVWDHSKFVPDWIIVNLGTNDFSSEANGKGRIDSTIFVTKYLEFVADLKSKFPKSEIILTVGCMMSDGYPTNAFHWSRIQAYVKAVVEHA